MQYATNNMSNKNEKEEKEFMSDNLQFIIRCVLERFPVKSSTVRMTACRQTNVLKEYFIFKRQFDYSVYFVY